MDLSVIKFMAMGIAIGLGVLGPALGLGWATFGLSSLLPKQKI